jgi:hypothetical protein
MKKMVKRKYEAAEKDLAAVSPQPTIGPKDYDLMNTKFIRRSYARDVVRCYPAKKNKSRECKQIVKKSQSDACDQKGEWRGLYQSSC